MRERPAILLAIPHLRGGGAAHVTLHLARGLAARGFEVDLVSMTDRVSQVQLPSEIHLHCLGARRVRAGAKQLVGLVRQVRPDAVLSCMTHLNMLILLLRPLLPGKTRILVRPDGVLSVTRRCFSAPEWFLLRRLYRSADAILCQSDCMAKELTAELGVEGRLYVVRNPVDVASIRDAVEKTPSKWRGPGPHLLAIGRLAPEKGFDLLLRAFAMLSTQFPHAELRVLGEGREATALQVLVVELGLGERVSFEGQVQHPEDWFWGATLFAMSSRNDAMPNALLEAAAAGLPLVATPALGGVTNLLRDQPGVWMAADISAAGLHRALQAALHAWRENERFAHAWIESFDAPAAMARYDAVIAETLRRARR